MRLESRTWSEEMPRNRNALLWMMGELRKRGEEKEAKSMAMKESMKKKVTTRRKTKDREEKEQEQEREGKEEKNFQKRTSRTTNAAEEFGPSH